MELGVAEKEAGNEAFKQEDYERAIECYTAAIAQNPSAEAYYSNRSAAYLRSEKFQSALNDADKCIELNPTWHKGYFRRGEALYALNLFARSSEAYSKALDLDPNPDVSLRQALAKAEKAVYEKAKSMAADDSDDELPMGPPQRKASDSSMSSFASSKRSEIINHRLAMGTGITSMEDYMRFKQAGGSNVPKDPTDPLASYTVNKNDKFQPTKSRADFLAEMGINSSPGASSYMSNSTPTSNYDDTYTGKSREETSSSGAMGNTANAEALAAKRAEFLASIGMTAESMGGTTGSSTSSSGAGAGVGAGASDWSKIRGSAGVTSSPSPSGMAYGSPASNGGGADMGGMSKADFIASLGLDTSDPTGGGAPADSGVGVPRGSALNMARSRSITPPHEQSRPFQPQAPVASGPPGGMSREEFIASMGLDARAPDEPTGKYTAASSSSKHSTKLPPEDSVDAYMRERDIMGGSPGTSSYTAGSSGGGLTSSSVGNSPSLGATLGSSTSGNDTPSSHIAGVAAQHTSQVVAGVQLKSAADYLASMGVGQKQQQQFNYTASGYNPGAGDEINSSWMSDFRKKKAQGDVREVGDTKAKELKEHYGDFHFRKFKEGAATLDDSSKEAIVGDAILAESLKGYDYDNFKS